MTSMVIHHLVQTEDDGKGTWNTQHTESRDLEDE